MRVLEQVNQMKNQGVSDEEVIQRLQDQGISPKAINEALSHSKIKRAVSEENSDEGDYSQPQEQDGFYPKTQEVSESEPYSPEGEGYYQEQPRTEEGYQNDFGDYSSGGIDTSTIIEIAEQVFSDKIQKIQRQTEDLTEFRVMAESRIENISERLRRIESTIDILNARILEKVSSYGDGIESVKKEMSMMQDSFRKMISPVLGEEENQKTEFENSKRARSEKIPRRK